MQKTQRTKVISGIRRMISEGKYTAGTVCRRNTNWRRS